MALSPNLPTAMPPSGNSAVAGSGGATTNIEYLETTEQRVSVNPNDLDDLLNDEKATLSLQGIGGFFLSGAFWLGVEKILEQPTFQLTVVIIGCGFSVIAGGVLLGAGAFLTNRRRGKIRRIMNNSRVIHNVSRQTSES